MKYIKHILILLTIILSINSNAAIVSVLNNRTSMNFVGSACLTDSTLTVIIENGRNEPSIYTYLIKRTYNTSDVFVEYTMSPAGSRNDDNDIHVRTIDNTMSIYTFQNDSALPDMVIHGYTDNTALTLNKSIKDDTSNDDSSSWSVPSWVWPTVGIVLLICITILVTAYLIIRNFLPRV